ncbi:S53 family peptidase [Flexivirga meconopsidis]|uniref:S53 family peptidase n=1 Tax=Flexivirga meconopsidis TaxID=2977121 RepID=UPI00223EA13E|nr:S53 family peptidase [Flexivirga meconopsidis]
MKRRHLAAGFVAVTTAVGMAGAGAGMAHAADNGKNIKLTNSGPASIKAHSKIQFGAAAPAATAMNLTLTVPLRNQALLDSFVAKGTVISPAEYKRLFAASPASVKKVADWAKSKGLKVSSSDTTAGAVYVTGAANKVNSAFGVQIRRASLFGVNGVAPNTDPTVPASLGVTGVSGLSTLARAKGTPPKAKAQLPKTGSTVTRPNAVAAAPARNTNCSTYWGQNLYVTAKKYPDMSNVQCTMSPQQIVSTYGVQSAATVAPSLGILLWGDDKNAKANANYLASYYKYPQLTNYTSSSDPYTGAAECGNDYTEQNLDIQSQHAVAPKASITYYGAASCSFDAINKKFADAVNAHKVSALSMSFGAPEEAGGASVYAQFNRIAQQASLTGMSILVSSGDMGDNTADGPKAVQFPSSSPFVTAVGGTAIGLKQGGGRQFTVGWATNWWAQPDPNSLNGIQETPAPHNGVGAGGGVSTQFAQPAWQKGVVTGSTTKRAVPDIAALADPATAMTISTGTSTSAFSSGGGTSQAAPLVAAMVGASKALTKRSIGNVAPAIYKLKGKAGLLDVVGPQNRYGAWLGEYNDGSGQAIVGVSSQPDSLRTAAGWDNITGVGEPAGQAFLTGLGG